MSLKSEDKKKLARKISLEDREIEELTGFVNYVIGKVHKVGREEVLKSYNTLHGPTEYWWLKQMYIKLLDNAQEVRVKRLPTKLSSEDKDGNAVPLVVYLPQVNSE